MPNGTSFERQQVKNLIDYTLFFLEVADFKKPLGRKRISQPLSCKQICPKNSQR